MGFFEKIKAGLAKTRQSLTISMNNVLSEVTGGNEEFYDELEDLLIMADAGVGAGSKAIEALRETVRARGLRGGEEIKQALIEILAERLEVGDRSLRLSTRPSVILMVGVNGVGKTTTIGKLADGFVKSGKRVLLCAGDTFRAAAAEQLTVWAERTGSAIVRHEAGADPAAVIFDGAAAAKAREVEIMLCDTAGRLHNKKNLMNELEKIARVLDRELPDCDRETLLVIDATTGQNGLIQAKEFAAAAGITGIVLTKLDGTAKGGIVFAIADELKVPVKFVGVGEQAEDLMPFEPRAFVEALLS